MIREVSSPSAPAAQVTETNTATTSQGDSMEIFNAGLTLMRMRHAGNRAEWHKDLRDAEKYDPFFFQAWQRDQTRPQVALQTRERGPRERKDGSPISDSETQSEGSSASTILLIEDNDSVNPEVEVDAGGDLRDQNEDVDEEMTEDEAENLGANGDSDSTRDRKISNSGQEDYEMVDSKFHPGGEAAPDDV